MKTHLLRLFVLTGLFLIGAGCGHVDVGGGGETSRVLKGAITTGNALPPGAEVSVRLFAQPSGAEMPHPGSNDLPIVTRPSAPAMDRVLGQFTQTLATGTTEPIPFQIEYTADDAVLRHGLNVEARISVGGKIRYRTINAHVVTLASSPYPQDITVQQVQ